MRRPHASLRGPRAVVKKLRRPGIGEAAVAFGEVRCDRACGATGWIDQEAVRAGELSVIAEISSEKSTALCFELLEHEGHERFLVLRLSRRPGEQETAGERVLATGAFTADDGVLFSPAHRFMCSPALWPLRDHRGDRI